MREIVGDPFGKLALLFAERIDMGTDLDAADWGAAATASIAGLSSLPLGDQELDVTPLVADALARGATRVDIRLRFGVAFVSDDEASEVRITSFVVAADPPTLPPSLGLRWRRSDS